LTAEADPGIKILGARLLMTASPSIQRLFRIKAPTAADLP